MKNFMDGDGQVERCDRDEMPHDEDAEEGMGSEVEVDDLLDQIEGLNLDRELGEKVKMRG